ncbi:MULTISPECIES: VOC family protein [unclassified Aureispira]|uniref:VOC family protein n=1 Tax=unclassified Aureispira TaxID=2649989 RepID=UPI000695E65D|nr:MULTISPECIES: VOC family protein [unclassified Aureispira]WMX12444.1 VOC family protein [Aureispira sp. CCB-E]
MKRVTGIGGIFFKTKDPQKSKNWYQNHLGIESDQYGATFKWLEKENPEQEGNTVWNAFPEDTTYFNPSEQEFMVNYRVDDLEALLTSLKEEGVTIVGEMQSFEYGKFAWILDPDGYKIELWEPVDEKL